MFNLKGSKRIVLVKAKGSQQKKISLQEYTSVCQVLDKVLDCKPKTKTILCATFYPCPNREPNGFPKW